jgi:hypothetical protein
MPLDHRDQFTTSRREALSPTVPPAMRTATLLLAAPR